MEPKFYQELWMHREMLRDEVRCKAYQLAIKKVVTPSTTVLDVGSGSSILAMFSVQAGARRVYAVERTAVIDIAKEIVKANGMQDKITFIQSDIETATLPEKVDVVTAEWMGGFGVDENLLYPILLARDRWLKPGGRMVPHIVTAMMAPVQDASIDACLSFFRSTPYGIDLNVIADRSASELHNAMHHVADGQVLAPAQMLWSTDSETCPLADADKPFKANLTFTAQRAGMLSGVAAWFTSMLTEGVPLTNAPDAPKTHWGRTVMPLTSPLPVNTGSTISVQFTCIPAAKNLCNNEWSIKVDNGEWQHQSGRQGCTASPGFH